MIEVISNGGWMKNMPFSGKVKMWIDIKQIPTTDSFNIFYVCEPFVINRHDTIMEWICQNWQHFNLVLTHDTRILKACPNAKPFSWTSALIPESEYELFNYNTKKFQVSFICGGKMMCQGHLDRRIVWMRQAEIKDIPRRCFYSTQVRGNLPIFNDNEPLDRESKKSVFIDSMFHIAMENCCIENYFSEKLTDCFIGKTVPIYYGCPNIGDFFDVRGIIVCKSVDDIIETVNNLTEADYNLRLEYIEKNRLIAIEKYPMNQPLGMSKMLYPIIDFKIFYGADNNYIDVTNKCRGKIPAGDEARYNMFGKIDPAFGKLKEIIIKYPKYTLIYPHYLEIKL